VLARHNGSDEGKDNMKNNPSLGALFHKCNNVDWGREPHVGGRKGAACTYSAGKGEIRTKK